jgi:hypothetical protein
VLFTFKTLVLHEMREPEPAGAVGGAKSDARLRGFGSKRSHTRWCDYSLALGRLHKCNLFSGREEKACCTGNVTHA